MSWAQLPLLDTEREKTIPAESNGRFCSLLPILDVCGLLDPTVSHCFHSNKAWADPLHCDDFKWVVNTAVRAWGGLQHLQLLNADGLEGDGQITNWRRETSKNCFIFHLGIVSIWNKLFSFIRWMIPDGCFSQSYLHYHGPRHQHCGGFFSLNQNSDFLCFDSSFFLRYSFQAVGSRVTSSTMWLDNISVLITSFPDIEHLTHRPQVGKHV